jgi:MoxR-like ATPase
LIKDVYVSPAVKRYIVELVDQTRQHADVYLGASPRGSLTLFRTGQARAAMAGRDFVLPDDVKALTVAALGHRVIVGPRARLQNLGAEVILQGILDELPIPEGDLNKQG